MPYKVLEAIGLPVWQGDLAVDTIRKEPGETITKAEMREARQSDEDVAALVKSGAIEEE